MGREEDYHRLHGTEVTGIPGVFDENCSDEVDHEEHDALVLLDGEDGEHQEAETHDGLGTLVEESAGEAGDSGVDDDENLGIGVGRTGRGYHFRDGDEDGEEDLVDEEISADCTRIEIGGISYREDRLLERVLPQIEATNHMDQRTTSRLNRPPVCTSSQNV